MAWAVADEGNTSNTTGATLALTVTNFSIAVGALVVVGVNDKSSATSGGSMTDSQGNNYISVAPIALNNTAANGFIQIFYSILTTALTVAVDTITYTKQTSGARCAMAALSATGGPTTGILDTAVTATNFGTSSISVTSGTPVQSGELFVALGANGNGKIMTADAGHGWLSPPLAAVRSGTGSTDAAEVGANQVNAGTGTIVWTPTGSAMSATAAIVVGFFITAPSSDTLFAQSAM